MHLYTGIKYFQVFMKENFLLDNIYFYTNTFVPFSGISNLVIAVLIYCVLERKTVL